jgi:hypothetical protein
MRAQRRWLLPNFDRRGHTNRCVKRIMLDRHCKWRSDIQRRTGEGLNSQFRGIYICNNLIRIWVLTHLQIEWNTCCLCPLSSTEFVDIPQRKKSWCKLPAPRNKVRGTPLPTHTHTHTHIIYIHVHKVKQSHYSP